MYTRHTLVPRPRINNSIRAPEVRIIGPEGENIGIKPIQEALSLAQGYGFDLIEVAPTANPPVVRIMDFGKYQYQLEKEARKSKKNAKEVEIKGIRVRLGTGTHDLILKAKKAEEFLREGNRVQIQLTLRGREKIINKNFIDERLAKILEAITVPFKTADTPKKGPRGLIVTIEPEHGKNKQVSPKKTPSNQNGQDPQTISPPKPLLSKEAQS